MPSLEYVIRPYQSPTPFRTIIIPSTPSPGRERATLTWGASGEATMPEPEQVVPDNEGTINYNYQCCQEQLNELSRENERKRIMGNDGVSYIDVDRPKTMSLKKNQKQRCMSPLEQESYVASSINSVLSSWDAEFAGRTETPDDNCHAKWYLSTP